MQKPDLGKKHTEAGWQAAVCQSREAIRPREAGWQAAQQCVWQRRGRVCVAYLRVEVHPCLGLHPHLVVPGLGADVLTDGKSLQEGGGARGMKDC